MCITDFNNLDTEQAMPKEKYDLNIIRHSSAHLMAHAIFRLFPNESIELGIGPVIDNGFYYDIKMEYKLTEEDLKKIEKIMKDIIKEDLPIKRQVMAREEAINFFKHNNQYLKIELIKEMPENEEITCYTQGDFTDLCRGPHVERTGELPRHFKLLHTAGAYWRGDSDRQMLQRVYATTFYSKEDLKKYLRFMEEAKKRDHRKLGKELELIQFSQSAPASPFFTPKGTIIYNELIDFMRRVYRKFHYQEVITPQVLDIDLWHTSGHYDNYKDNMFFSIIDNKQYAIKPMNCPCHMLMYKNSKYSYRDLPLRYADFGRLHRYEKSGTLAGLTRVRTFCQDDAHIFIQLEKIQDEILELMDMFFICYEHFKFEDIKIYLSTRPEKKVGDDHTWDVAESALKKALDGTHHEYEIREGDGAFYGPKIDVEIADAIKRFHQLGTIQLDFQLPERFDLKFVNKNGEMERPVVIHRALLGSLERFYGVYLEHVAGAYPFWLAPVQAVIVPVRNDDHLPYCKDLFNQLEMAGYRINLDERNESIGYKTRQIQKSKIPFMIVIGDREKENNTVSIRKYGEKNSSILSTEELKQLFYELNLEKIPKALRSK